jgi:hypothetical protein
MHLIQIEDDLLHPNPANEKKKHKLKRLVQAPNSFFMDVKCPGCFNMLVSLFVSCLQVYEYVHVLYCTCGVGCLHAEFEFSACNTV